MFANRYRLDARIAEGGVGEVWQGTDLALDRRVAIKLLRPEFARDDDGLARFRAEAHHAGLLSHPNIAHVYDFCESGPAGPGYLVLEFVDGPSLARVLDNGPLDPARTMGIVAQAARGLAAAHRAGLVHRDIKPGNLLVGTDGVVKVTDFGIAQAAGAAPVTRTGALIGTPGYLAPERGAGLPATPATDLYSLGIVAHQCLTGQMPFRGAPLAVVIAHMERPLPPLPPSVPPGVAALVAELASKEPRDRPPSAGDVALRADYLGAAASGTALPAPPLAGPAFPGAVPGAAEPSAGGDGPAAPWAAASQPPSLLPAGPLAAAGPVPARDRHWLTGLPSRAALALTAVGAAGLLGWTVLAPGSVPGPRHPLSRPSVPRQITRPGHLAGQAGTPGRGTPGQGARAAAPPASARAQGSTRTARPAAPPAVASTSAAPAPATPTGAASPPAGPSATPVPTAPSGSPSSTASPDPTPSGSVPSPAGSGSTLGPGSTADPSPSASRESTPRPGQ